MWQLLVKEGFDCSSRNREGQTPADCALLMGHKVLAERIRELGWDRYKDMPAFNAYTAPPPNEDADDGRSAQRLCRDAHLAAESAAAANKAPDPAHRPSSARPSSRKGSQGERRPWLHAHEGGVGVGAAEGAAAQHTSAYVSIRIRLQLHLHILSEHLLHNRHAVAVC